MKTAKLSNIFGYWLDLRKKWSPKNIENLNLFKPTAACVVATYMQEWNTHRTIILPTWKVGKFHLSLPFSSGNTNSDEWFFLFWIQKKIRTAAVCHLLAFSNKIVCIRMHLSLCYFYFRFCINNFYLSFIWKLSLFDVCFYCPIFCWFIIRSCDVKWRLN